MSLLKGLKECLTITLQYEEVTNIPEAEDVSK